MLDKYTRESTDYLIRNHVINEGDRDVYEYGFHALYNNIIDISSIIILSMCFNLVPETILYHFSFVVLRTTAGGYHAKTHFRCFVMSTSMWLISLWGISHLLSTEVSIGFAVLSVILVWSKAPIEHENSPLSGKKQRRMKVLSRSASIVLLVVVLLIATILDKARYWIAASLAYGMASHAILMIGALIQKSAKTN